MLKREVFQLRSRRADRRTFQAAERRVDPEMKPGLHGVILVVHPEGEQTSVTANQPILES